MRINKELLIGKKNLELYISASIDGKEVIPERRANCLVGNFLKILHLQMGAYSVPLANMPPFSYVAADFRNVASITSGVGGKCRMYCATGLTGASSGKVVLNGFVTSGTAISDGVYSYTKVVSDNYIDVSDGPDFSAIGAYTANSGAVKCFVESAVPADFYMSNYGFNTPTIVVGTDNTAVALSDYCLKKEIANGTTARRLSYGVMNIATDTETSTYAEESFTQTFTNSTGSTITIYEIGMYTKHAINAAPLLLIMRDLIDGGIAITSAKTLTVNYKLRSTLTTAGTDPGGFLSKFMTQLNRAFALSAKSITNTDNGGNAGSWGNHAFRVTAGAGLRAMNGSERTSGNGDQAWKYGIVLGRDDTAVAQGNYFLGMPIVHGSGSNEMLQYGCFMTNFVEDADYVSFDIVKVFENNSGSAITVKEIGLTGGNVSTYTYASNSYLFGCNPNSLFLMARNVFTTPVVVNDQVVLKVTYTIKILLP